MLHKKVKKFIKKAIPKEIAPFVPAIAGMFLGPAAAGIMGKFGAGLAAKSGILGGIGSLLSKPMVAGALGRGLVDVGAQALTSDRIDPLSAAMSAGLGALSEYRPGSVLGKADTRSARGASLKRPTGGLRGGLDKVLTKGRELGRVGRLDDAGFDFIKTGKLANVQGTTKAASDELAIQKETAKRIAMESAAFQAADSAGRRDAIVQAMIDAGFDRTEANAAATEEGYAMGGRVGFERGGTFQAAQQALSLFNPMSVTQLGGNMARRDISGNRVLYGPESLSDEYQGLDDLGRSLALRTVGGGRGRGRVRGGRFGVGNPNTGIAAELQGEEGRRAFADAKAQVEQQRRDDSRAALDFYGLSDVTDTQADALSDALQGFYTGSGPTAFGGINTGGVTSAEAADAARQAREMATRNFATFLGDNPGLAQTIQGGITDFVRGTVGRQMGPQTLPVEDQQAEETDLFDYMKLAGFEEGGQVGMPERGGGANEEAMADLMMKLDSGEFYLDEEGNLRRIPRRRPRMNTRPGMNEDAIADQMFMMQMNERMGRKEGGTIPGLPAGRQVDAREGTFIPMGGAKRADDVPAMLSVNEFVLNDDAVAGLGKMMTGKPDPRAGARALYKIQDQLEAMV